MEISYGGWLGWVKCRIETDFVALLLQSVLGLSARWHYLRLSPLRLRANRTLLANSLS